MLYLLFVYFFISFVCLLSGILFYEFLFPSRNSGSSPDKPFVFYTFSGLILLTGFAQWIALFLPITAVISGIITISVFILCALYRKRVAPHLQYVFRSLNGQSFPFFLSLLFLLATVATQNSGPTHMDDTESYHIQMVKWLQEYGTVPGLANLHIRYGFNSSWFSSVALLAPKLGTINTYLSLNGVVSCWFCQYLLEKLSMGIRDGNNRNNVNILAGVLLVMLLGLYTWPMVRGNPTTINYDFITASCLLFLFIEASLSSKFKFETEWFVWPCYIFTIRYFYCATLLLSVYALWNAWKTGGLKPAIMYVLSGIFLLTPFIARNVILSGYPFLPIYQVDIFNVDWKSDKRMAIANANYIKYYNRIYTNYMPIAKTKLLSFPYWIPDWFRTKPGYDKPVTILGILGYFSCIAGFKVVRKRLPRHSLILLSIMLLQVLIWFFSAPDPRFVYGPLLCGAFALFMVIPLLLYSGKIKKIVPALPLTFAAGLLVFSIHKITINPDYQNWLVPQPVSAPPFHTVVIDGIKMHIPEKINNNWNPRCFGTELPCLYQVHPALRARGKRISDGFYLDNPDRYTFEEGTYY